MCLEIKHRTEPKVTDKPIECYKLFMIRNKHGKLYAPYRDYDYTIGQTHTTELQLIPTFHNTRYSQSYEVEKGFHSFTSLEDAQRYLEIFFPYGKHRMTIRKCTIPKGALLYKGRFINGMLSTQSYCSNKITVL